jgi:hypothetical protein
VELPAGAFTQDALVIVHAAKEHHVGGRIERSSVELQRALIQLVRPDSHRALVLSALTSAEVVTGPWLVLDGQPGVFYELRVDSGAIALPAYFHQQDELAPFYNKGHGRLRIGADFVITRDRPLGDASDVTITPPLAPRLHSTPIPSGSLVRVSARKAMTSIDAMLVGTVVVSGAPKVRLEPATVAPGGRVLIMVEQSVPGDRYELLEDGQPRYEALVGDGADLGWESNVLTRRTEFTLVIRLSHSPQLSFVRRIDRVAEVEGEP